MDRYVVVSTNNNPDYIFFAPFIEQAWAKLGWKLVVMVTRDVNKDDLKLSHEALVFELLDIEGVRSESIAQAGRLYAANFVKGFLMTSDMDMLPLSDYWHPNENEITVYGHDLTWHSFYPMCYVAMHSAQWMMKMNLTGNTKRDMFRDSGDPNVPHSPLSKEWEQWWNYDWSLLTERLSKYKSEIKFIDRGQIDIAGATLAKGRIDRYNWGETQNQPEPFIDAHCHNTSVHNPERKEAFLKVFNKYCV